MKEQNLAIEPILEAEEAENQWVQEEEKLRNERLRWEERKVREHLHDLFPAQDFKRLLL